MVTYHQRITAGVLMRLTVVGTSAQARLLATAASLNAGEPISVVGAGDGATRTIRCDGLLGPGSATLEYRTVADPGDLVVVAGDSVADILDLYERHATRARHTVLIPGGAGGSLCANAVATAANDQGSVVAEASGFPFLGVVAGDTVTYRARKDRLPIGGVDARATADVAEALRRYVPGVEPVDTLVTSLANMNHVIHPAIALANLTRIDRGEPFHFYREGISPATMRIVSAIDRERRTLTDRLGQPDRSAEDWFATFYGEQGYEGRDLFDGLSTFPPFEGSLGPMTVEHRYLVDDVRYGIAVYEALGSALDVATPIISAVITTLCAATGSDLRDTASPLAALLLAHHGARSAPETATAPEPAATRRH
jgi:opine dehydrogenase